MSNTSDAAVQRLLESNVNALKDGLEMVQMLDAELFTQTCEPAFQSSIGMHFRHVLEHYVCFLEQCSERSVSYELRRRDMRIEMDIRYAEAVLQAICAKVQQFDAGQAPSKLQVSDQPFSQAVESTLERELLFLLSHTVHHYAMIAAMARILGKSPKRDFGVAFATQAFLANSVSA